MARSAPQVAIAQIARLAHMQIKTRLIAHYVHKPLGAIQSELTISQHVATVRLGFTQRQKV
jgi:hypothetical protein